MIASPFAFGKSMTYASRGGFRIRDGGGKSMERATRVSLGPDLVFAIILGTGLISGRAWLNDPGSPWHLRLGRDILATGSVPRADTLTWTRQGTPWVDQSWLFDVALAKVVDVGGWSLAVGLAVLSIAWLYRTLTRWLEADGVSPLSAATTAILAAGVGSVHFLVRPHLVTFALVAWTVHACRVHHERGGRILWTIPPLMVVWANCHGGFLAGPVILATAIVGEAISGPWDFERQDAAPRPRAVSAATGAWRPSARHTELTYTGTWSVSSMTSGVTGLIDEYQPMPFGKPTARVFEWVLLALVALPSLTGRKIGRYDLTHGLVWLHFALGSIRNAPLFGLAIAPALGRQFDGAFSAGRMKWSEPLSPSDRGTHMMASLTVIAVALLGWETRPIRPGEMAWRGARPS